MSHLPSVTLCGKSIGRPGHICAFFDSRQQEYDVLAPYYLEGLRAGEEVVTIVDAHRHADHCAQMSVRGVPVDELLDDQLKVLTAEDTYTAGGSFDATRMYDLLQGALADAKQRGRRVRTSGVMDWSNANPPGTEQLMDYESRVNVLVPMYDCTLLCVYDVSKVGGQMMLDILQTHPYVVHRRRVIENPYYTAPLDLLKEVLLDQRTLPGQASQPS